MYNVYESYQTTRAYSKRNAYNQLKAIISFLGRFLWYWNAQVLKLQFNDIHLLNQVKLQVKNGHLFQ